MAFAGWPGEFGASGIPGRAPPLLSWPMAAGWGPDWCSSPPPRAPASGHRRAEVTPGWCFLILPACRHSPAPCCPHGAPLTHCTSTHLVLPDTMSSVARLGSEEGGRWCCLSCSRRDGLREARSFPVLRGGSHRLPWAPSSPGPNSREPRQGSQIPATPSQPESTNMCGDRKDHIQLHTGCLVPAQGSPCPSAQCSSQFLCSKLMTSCHPPIHSSTHPSRYSSTHPSIQ